MLTERQQQIKKLIDRGYSNDQIAEHLGISYGTVRSHKKVINRKIKNSADQQKMDEEENFTTDFNEDKGKINSLTYRLKTVDDVINFAEVDLNEWEVERAKTNYYEMGRKDKQSDLQWNNGVVTGTVKDTGDWNTNRMWSISVWFKRKIKDPVNEALNSIIERVEDKQPVLHPIKFEPVEDPHLLELSICDAHFGKMTVKEESLEQTEQIYNKAVDVILRKTEQFNIDKILLPLGSDFFHIDNFENTTKKGTRQDVNAHLFDVFDAGCNAVVNLIYKLRTVAPLELVWVPGNHDYNTSRYLSTFIKAWFRNDKNITVRVGKNPRKYIKYGSTLIGLTHGNEEKHIDLPNLMMTENRHNINDVNYFEWHIGHKHKKKEMKFVSADTIGHIPVKTLTSLSGTDYWHLMKGFLSNRVMESYLFNHQYGPSGYFNANIEEIF